MKSKCCSLAIDCSLAKKGIDLLFLRWRWRFWGGRSRRRHSCL